MRAPRGRTLQRVVGLVRRVAWRHRAMASVTAAIGSPAEGGIRSLILAALLLVLPASAVAADVDWRPPQPDRLALLDTALAPSLALVEDTVELVIADITVITAYVKVGSSEVMRADMQARLEAVTRMEQDTQAIIELAAAGLAILREVVVEVCFAEYWAVTLAGFLTLGDSGQSVQVGDYEEANVQVQTARYLLGPYGDLTHAVAVEGCAG